MLRKGRVSINVKTEEFIHKLQDRWRRILSTHKNSIIWVTLILLLGLLSFTWFREDYLIDGYDLELPLSPLYHFKASSFTWSCVVSVESANSIAALFPKATFFVLGSLLGFSILTSEKLLFYVLFTSSGLSMYFLTSKLLKGKERHLAGFISALFYMMNPYTLMFRWNHLGIWTLFLYVTLPFTFYFLVVGLEERKKHLKYAFYFGLTTLFFASSATTPAWAILAWLIIFSYVVFHIICLALVTPINKSKIIHSFRFVLLIVVIYFALNIWWILSVIWLEPTSYGRIFVSGPEAARTILSLRLESQVSSFLNVFRMLGHWSFYTGVGEDLYYPFAPVYWTPLFVILSLIIPIIAFSSLLWSKNKYVIFFTGMSVLAIFLMKGTYPPFGEIYDWMFFNIPFFRIFRMQHDKFGIIQTFSYAFLIGYSLAKLYYTIQTHALTKHPFHFVLKGKSLKLNLHSAGNKVMLIVMLILLFGVYMFPFWTGDVILSPQKLFKGHRVRIPLYYYDAGSWINEQDDDFKIFSLPFRRWTTSMGATYTWGYDGGDITKHIIQRVIIMHGMDPPPQILTNSIYEMLAPPAYPTSAFGKFLGLLNVRYILLHNDYDYVADAGIGSPQDVKVWLGLQKGIHFNRTFGQLDFYENDYFVPQIYATNNLLYTNTILGKVNFIDNVAFTPNPPAIFSSDIYAEPEPSNPNIPLILDNVNKFVLRYEAEDYFNNTGWEIFKIGEWKNTEILGAYYRKTASDATISYNVSIPKSGTYRIYAYVRWGADRGALKYKFDEDSWSKAVNPYAESQPELKYYYNLLELGESFLLKGNHTFTIMNTVPFYGGGYQDVDYFLFESISDEAAPEEGKVASIVFQRVDPTKYEIHVNAIKPFFLVFSEPYHSEWKAYYESDLSWIEALWKKPISDDKHFLVNGYANAWYIDKSGEYDIILYFRPQSSVTIGLIISVSSFFACLTYLLMTRSTTKFLKKGI